VRIAGEKLLFVISLCAFFSLDSTSETFAILAYTFNLNSIQAIHNIAFASRIFFLCGVISIYILCIFYVD